MLRTRAKGRDPMNDDVFNMEIRKFLKIVGVTSQREIEQAVKKAIEKGGLKGNERLKARVTLTIDSIGFAHELDGEIALE
jgi:predicted lactoylglutathione lyase